MAEHTKIEWTDSTWNPVTGCTKVSAGCKNCYAERDFHRPYPGRDFTDVRVHPERLDQPLRWKRPRKIFVNSMSDLFHESIPVEFLLKVFETMAWAKQHTFQLLTKRADRMRHLLAYGEKMTCDSAEHHRLLCTMPLPNVWLGASVENQPTADERIPLLLQTPAVVHFVSYEPALGPVDLTQHLPHYRAGPDADDEIRQLLAKRKLLDWVVAGGESGPHARPSHPDWFRLVRDQCAAAGVPFFFKQWGEWGPGVPGKHRAPVTWVDPDYGPFSDHSPTNPMACVMVRMGRKLAGRLLDGREWNELPKDSAGPGFRTCGTSERTARPESGSSTWKPRAS